LLTNDSECFDRSRSLTAGFLDGLQFRARRGISMNGKILIISMYRRLP
jgi:hypothetical protein